MADVLRDVSDFYGRELKTVIKAVTSMIEPIMIVCMGCHGRLHRHEHHSADLQDVEPGHGKVGSVMFEVGRKKQAARSSPRVQV